MAEKAKTKGGLKLWHWLILVLVVLVMASISYAYYQYKQAMKYCYKVTKLKIKKFTKDRIILDLNLLIKNVAQVGTKVLGYKIDIIINGKYVGSAQSDQNFKVSGDAISTIPVTVDINPKKGFNTSELASLVSWYITDKTKIILTFKGWIKAPLPIFQIPVRVPVEITYNLKEYLEDDPEDDSCTF
jgi:LEA14-like dessication related protein